MAEYPVFIEPEQAVQFVLQAASERLLPVESVRLEETLGRCVQAPIIATLDHPPFNRAAMDGFAVAFDGEAVEPQTEFELVGESHAGIPFSGRLVNGQAVRISTGAIAPDGTSAILPVENSEERSGKVLTLVRLERRANLALKGEDRAKGEPVVLPGQEVSAAALSALASEGRTRVWVRRLPKVVVVSTGDEVVPHTETPPHGWIRNMNTPTIEAWCRRIGVEVVSKLHTRDSFDELLTAVTSGFNAADVVLLSGGVSAGERDLVVPALKRIGAKIWFHKVRQKPGKPLLLATLGSKMFFGLPGNPLTVVLMLELYVLPALRAMQELPSKRLWFPATLSGKYQVRGKRDVFEVGRLALTEDGFEFQPLYGAGSADVFHRATGNAIGVFPAKVGEFAPGDKIEVSLMSNACGWLP